MLFPIATSRNALLNWGLKKSSVLIINHIEYFKIYIRYLLLFSEWKFVVMYVMLEDIDVRVASIALLVSQRCS